MWRTVCPWDAAAGGWGFFWVLHQLFWLALIVAAGYAIYRLARRPANRGTGLYSGFRAEKCPNCSAPVEAAYLRCPECGHQLKRNCPECGKIVKTHWKVCPYCESDLQQQKHEQFERSAVT